MTPRAYDDRLQEATRVSAVNRAKRRLTDWQFRGEDSFRPGRGRANALITRGAVRVRLDRVTCAAHASMLKGMSKMIQLRNVPEALHRQLKARAAMAGLSLSDFLIREARKIAEQPTPEEMAERLRQREPYRGKLSPTQVLREERDAR